MKKVKICFLVSSLCNEGPVNVVYNIIKYINFKKFDVSIITFIPEKKTSKIGDFRKLPITIVQLAKNRPIGIWKMYKELKKNVDRIRPEILHSHCPRSLYLMSFLPKRYKKVYTIHIYPGLQQLKLYGNVKGRIVIALNHFFTKRCDLPIGCSESVSEQYKHEKGWDIACVPNGTSMPVWKIDDQERMMLRNEFGLKADMKYFIFIGRFSKEKNPDILVESFGKIKRNDIGLIMLGDGPMWKELNEIKTDNVIMPGFTSRVYDYLKASDYYISVSDVEGLANTILESMSVGLPMLLSDIPSHREVLSNIKNDVVGYIIDNKNSDDIIDKIARILAIDTKKTAQILQDLYKRKYTAEVMSMKYQKEYMQLLGKNEDTLFDTISSSK